MSGIICCRLRQQSVLEGLPREPGHRRGERIGRVRIRDLDQRNAETGSVVRKHLPRQRLVGEPAGVGRGAVAIVVGRVVGECAVGAVLTSTPRSREARAGQSHAGRRAARCSALRPHPAGTAARSSRSRFRTGGWPPPDGSTAQTGSPQRWGTDPRRRYPMRNRRGGCYY